MELAAQIRRKHCIRGQIHISREGSTEESLAALLDAAVEAGVSDALLLGGAPGSLRSGEGGSFGSTLEMVKLVKSKYADQIKLAVCGYPEGTAGEAGSYEADLLAVKEQARQSHASFDCSRTHRLIALLLTRALHSLLAGRRWRGERHLPASLRGAGLLLVR